MWANSLRATVSQRRDELFATQQELQRVNARQEFLYKQLTTSVVVGQQITSILDLDKLLQEVTDLIRRQFGFDYVGLFLLSEDGRSLQVRAESGQTVNDDAEKPTLPPGRALPAQPRGPNRRHCPFRRHSQRAV